jgi:PAS domain S-box-containing protein
MIPMSRDDDKSKAELIQELEQLRKARSRLEQELSALKGKIQGSCSGSDLKYYTLFEQSNEGIFLHNLQGNILEANDAARAMFGYSQAELSRLTIPELHPREALPASRKAFNEVIQNGSANFEIAFETKDGRTFWAEVSARVLDIDGEQAVLGLVRDISERKRTEDQIRSTNRRLAQIIDFLPDATFVIDTGGEVIAWNRAMEELTDVYAGDMIGKSDYEYAIPIYGQRRPLLIDLVLDPREELEARYSNVVWKDGSVTAETYLSPDVGRREYHLWGTATVLYDEQGRVIGAIESIRDITERKQNEEALKISEAKYKFLVDNTTDGIFIIQDWRIKVPNSRLAVITGYTQEEIEQIPVLELIHPCDRDRVRETHLKRMAGEKPPESYSFWVITKYGENILVELSAVVISWQSRPATLNTLRDKTHQHLREQQLERAQRMESIGTLAGGIAHDFNNLLMAIQGGISIILLKKDPHDWEFERLKSIEQYVQDGAELTQQLLGFARGGKFETRTLNPQALVQQSSRMFSRTRKELTVETRFPAMTWPIDADPGQMEQVLLNLYINAWQAMPHGGTLFLETANVEIRAGDDRFPDVDPGKYVRISVGDNGVGMDPETQKKIFDPFFTTKEIGRGTGLGLASVYGIVKNHKGFIEVSSHPGAGSTFDLYLPTSTKGLEEAGTEADTMVQAKAAGETILLVDDEDMILEVTHELLTSSGYQVLKAGSGSQALELYQRHIDDIDIVLLDMIMPGMNGAETYDRLKSIDPDVKVILTSGYSVDAQAEKIFAKGCNGFLQKPFTIKSLSSKITAVLQQA